MTLLCILEALDHIATILGVAGILFALLSWRSSRNSFHHTVITSCTSRFQELSLKLLTQLPLSKEAVQQYLELCNEELFYFESKFLPQPIIDEWLDGMLSFIHLRREDGSLFQLAEVTPSPETDLSPPFPAEYQQFLQNYPRLNYAFRVTPAAEKTINSVHSEYGSDAARAEMVLTVLANLRSYKEQPFLKHLHRARTTMGSNVRNWLNTILP
ncbi:hypothetical protein H8B15_15955 [Hymenobacter sp. BT507]|uniref:Uncharacterized protein n=1 Tax=Hymenobacter citatus TaxID=2763506 RepID=A0ABR7MPG7_9BACT|nr:hypothetical protein [Hymenobacter citatus]MBC6612418.1 hypothetical protein [Hymenobacter citatus]